MSRIINCHTHIFTADHVPPFLARTLVPWPFYYLLPVSFFVRIFRWWLKNPYRWRFQTWYKRIARFLYRIRMALSRYWVLAIIKTIIGLIIIASIYNSLYPGFIRPWLQKQNFSTTIFDKADEWLIKKGILIITNSLFLKAFLLIVLLLFFPSGRNLLWFILRQTSRFFRMLPGKQTRALLMRYVDIVRFARYERQQDIFTKLTNQYPVDAAMIVLPMDLEFMEAGKQKMSFEQQMADLATLKSNRPDKIFPFLFIDPRRKSAGGKPYFEYEISKGKVVLLDCFVRDYMETENFSGFKIYPALGYFPFDEILLPLWKYAADNGIPVMTHCIRGVIYYRGPKKKEWDYHPVFKQAMGNGTNDDENPGNEYEPMLLSQMKPVDVQEIFTHPLNYACLLKKELLAQLIARSSDLKLKELFGYNEDNNTIENGLDHLKICFGHFGGEDEWEKFLQKDRDNYSSQIERKPDFGIDFCSSPGKPEQIWRSVDWYSIIISLMLQHQHIYADISYILHGDVLISPLLKKTLQHEVLKERVLYGSDFYVVRNHKSDKQMLAEMMGGLSKNDFDQIARINPVRFLAKNISDS